MKHFTPSLWHIRIANILTRVLWGHYVVKWGDLNRRAVCDTEAVDLRPRWPVRDSQAGRVQRGDTDADEGMSPVYGGIQAAKTSRDISLHYS